TGFAQVANPSPDTTTTTTTTTTPAAVAATDSEQSPVVLSPFEVDSTQDTGYRARNTLAGSRINTDLKDVAGPITVVTKDFIDDIGAVDVNDILTYTVGTEGTKDFSSNTPQLGRTSDNAAQDPNGATRGRGLAPFDFTRDYFYSLSDVVTGYSSQSVGFDTYNLDTVTVIRGADSILAGLGSPSGIINFEPQVAGLERNSYDLSYRFGSYGDKRGVFNANVVAIPDVLAFRIATVYKDVGYEAQPAYNHDKRYYLATTWKPFKKTTIHASYEDVRVKEHLPATFTPEDDITQWIQLGKPAAPAPAAAGTGSAGTVGIPNSTASFYQEANGGYPNSFYNANGGYIATYNNASLYEYQQQNLSGVALWAPLRMSNDMYGNWHELNTNGTHQTNSLETVEASIDQEVFPHFNINGSVVHEIANYSELNLGRVDFVADQVDVNQTLPWGAANPNFGQTQMFFSGLDNQNATYSRNTVARATATYDLDLNKYNKWFGRYVFTGFAEDRKTTNDFVDYNAQQDGTATAVGSGPGIYTYTGGTAANNYYQNTVAQVPGLLSNAPLTSIPTAATATAAATLGGVTTNSFSDFYALKEEQRSITKLTTSAFILQAYVLDDLAVGTFGIRRDKDQAGFLGSSTDANTGQIIPIQSGQFDTTLSEVQAQTKTYSVVLHGPKIGSVDLKWLSVGYDQSQNFIPNAGSTDLLGHPTPDPTGMTKDYNISVDLFGGKLNAKIDWYTTIAANSSDPTVNFPLVQWSIPFITLANNNSNGMGAYADLARQVGFTGYQSGLAPGITTGDAALANAYTSNQQAKGMEFELTYNVNKNWRISGTVDRQQAEESGIAPALTSFINQRVAYWQANGLWNGPTTTKQDWCGCPETGQQVYNNDVLGPFIAYQSANGQPSEQLHKWKATLVTNYTFDQGIVKGLGVGTGLRYFDKTDIGNPVTYTNINGTQTVTGLDLQHPYTVPGQTSVEAWLTYSRRVYDKKYLLTFRFEVQNLQSGGGYTALAANSDGTHQLFGITPPRTYYFTTDLKF
ncbi:MAG TPA: TonB-dependent receptor plug domain-containing protein, partial [Opitutaceae bacterium]|nr:TonB-dependent receptor plug domain-containing protein [Opitutaceae bacterium]